jgi:hypothetical protein
MRRCRAEWRLRSPSSTCRRCRHRSAHHPTRLRPRRLRRRCARGKTRTGTTRPGGFELTLKLRGRPYGRNDCPRHYNIEPAVSAELERRVQAQCGAERHSNNCKRAWRRHRHDATNCPGMWVDCPFDGVSETGAATGSFLLTQCRSIKSEFISSPTY